MDINKISTKLNISPSTVRKALQHKRSVDSNTRELVFAELGDSAPRAKSGDKPSVGIVLPSNPFYYWDLVYHGIKSALSDSVDAHFAFFSSLGSGHEGVHAINFVSDLDLCIIAPSVAPAVQAKIAELSVDKPIIYVNDGLATPQIATVCGNYYDDGLMLGKAYSGFFPDHSRILTLHVHNGLGSQMRTNGFKKAVLDSGCEIVGNIELEDITSSFASVIARRIHSEFFGKFDCLYCATGATSHAALALSKLKLPGDVFCIGYENPDANSPFVKKGIIRLLSTRNAYQLGNCAGEIALNYLTCGKKPAVPTVYVPSEIFVNKLGALERI